MNHRFSEIVVFPHKHRLARVIRSRGRNESVVEVAKAIYNTHLKQHTNFRAAVRFFLDVCITVDFVKQRTIGKDAPTDVSNDVQVVIGHELLKAVPWDGQDMEWLQECGNFFQAENDVRTVWGATKLLVLHNAMKHIFATQQFAAQRLPIAESLLREAEREYETMETHLRWMMDALVELRRYGVKSSFTQQGFATQNTGAWVMWDFRDFSRITGRSRDNMIATVSLADDAKQIKDLRLEGVLKDKTKSTVIELPFPAHFIWALGRDGEIELSNGLGSLPARQIFEQAGNNLIYQVVRARLIYHLYDLVVPVARLATLPAAPMMKKGLLVKLKAALGRVDLDPVRDFLIPRIKLIEARAELHEAAEQEVERSMTETERRAKRRHDVVDFIRPLPPGHRPSPQARQRAFEAFGIELGDNETYVRAHKRGKGNEITAHEARPA